MRRWLVFIAVAAGLAHMAGCKGVGTVCDQSGSTSQCGDGKICTFARNPGDPNDPNNNLPPLEVCLRLCDKSSDCGEGEVCQIVFCSEQKSCQTGSLPDPPPDLCGTGGMGGRAGAGGTAGGGGGPGVELRPLPDIYTTGKAINYSAFRAGGPGVGEIPSDADILEDLGLLQTAGYDLLRLFGADAVSEKILRLAAENFPEMRFQQGLFLEGLAPGPPADLCESVINDSQVETAIRLANTYSSVVTVSVGNETSFFAPFMPLNCLEGYITETRDNVTQPVTADDDYTFYAGTFARKPDTVLPLIDFVSIHTYPFINYQQWDWKQEGVPAGPLRAEAMMNAALAKAQDNYQAVYDYRYRNTSGTTVTIGESLPIVIGETGWKWRQTAPTQEIEIYAALPVNAKWYIDLLQTWEGSPGGPLTIFPFEAFDETWKGTDDGWGFWDEFRMPLYALCGTPAGSACNDPLYEGAGYYSP